MEQEQAQEGQEIPEEEVAVEEGEDYADRPDIDLSFLEGEKKPSVPERIAPKVAEAAERAGTATHRVLARIGDKLEPSGPPSDDISDLFEGPDMERDNDVYIKDLVTISEEDVFGEGGADMSDLLEVDEVDVMGEEDYMGLEGPEQREQRPIVQPTRRLPPQRASPPPSGIAGLQP